MTTIVNGIVLRKGTTAENDGLTGLAQELTADTTLNRMRLHDGTTPGGHEVALTADIGTYAYSKVEIDGILPQDVNTATPVWSTPPTAMTEGEQVTVTLSNYDPNVVYYFNSSANCTFDTSGAHGTWTVTAPSIDIADTMSFEIFAIKAGSLKSPTVTQTVNVSVYSFAADTAANWANSTLTDGTVYTSNVEVV